MRIKRLVDNILQTKIRLQMRIRSLRMKKLADKAIQLKDKKLADEEDPADKDTWLADED
jgi:hypothetical protein